jgi:hypothetical protein
MKSTFRFSVITKMLGGLAAGSLATATLGEPVFGNVIFDLAANPPAVTVMQGQNAPHPIAVTLSMQPNIARNVSFQAIVNDPTRAPEPGTMALFGIGLIGIGTIGRKLKRGKRSEINL